MFKNVTRALLATGIMVSSLGIASVANAQPFFWHHHHWHHRHWEHNHWRYW